MNKGFRMAGYRLLTRVVQPPGIIEVAPDLGFSDRRSRPFRIGVFITLAVRERAYSTSSFHRRAP
jgi:hypothetical protein